MSKNVSKGSSEKPLLGAVICCTSIAPEERSVLAEYAQQMGAEHKLDLTSDVTHLLVGSTNTPKYQYVAREREDVKVLRPEWVQAVRQCWMEDRALDMHALEAEFHVPAFAYLKICITGFDDLNVRAEIASAVRKHGGEYTGDLTKDVTHLIAAEPTGKKFEYATIWQKKVVSLKWYTDSIERGMQLDETKYHPSSPHDQQGLDAWNRQRQKQSVIGKRVRDGTSGIEPVRKLRRTASSKFGSQNENMWGDIVGGGKTEQPKRDDRDVLRPSKSMPVLSRVESEELQQHDNQIAAQSNAAQATTSHKYLSGTCFNLQEFDSKRRSILLNALTNLGAQVCETLDDLLSNSVVRSENSFIMVPHQCRASSLPFLGDIAVRPDIVTELWLEKCMIEKSFVVPKQYALGGLAEEIKAPAIASFTINATGFPSLETLHISKMVALAGAKYEEVFKPQCSILVCKSGTTNQSKLFHAQQWNIPVVSEHWLWDFITSGGMPAVDKHLILSEQDDGNDLHKQFKQNRRQSRHDSNGEKADKRRENTDRLKEVTKDNFEKKEGVFANNAGPENRNMQSNDSQLLRNRSDHSFRDPPRPPHDMTKQALKEMSPNSPVKKTSVKAESFSRDRHASLDGASDIQTSRKSDVSSRTMEAAERYTASADAESVQSAIQDLLNIKARAKSSAQAAGEQTSSARNKKKILGRALSNLSNSSRISNPRLSRASSIDSLNTDGVGSELAPPSAGSRAEEERSGGRHVGLSLLGRAQPRGTAPLQSHSSVPIDISDPNLCRDEFNEAEQEPQLTQLGYEDSEEAVALRAKLVERRRARAKGKDQTDAADLAAVDQVNTAGQKRVIKDDETVLALEGQTGWGGGRRTRRREKEVTNDIF